VTLRPDLSSYNRAAYFRFLYNDVDGAVKIMKMAISAGSPMAENSAWCEVELGKIYLKTGKVKEAAEAFGAALRRFPNYHPALAGVAQAAAAQSDWKTAIVYMHRAQAATPLPDYSAALFDYYTASGDAKEAARQKELIQVIDQVGQAAKEKANRNIAMIYAMRITTGSWTARWSSRRMNWKCGAISTRTTRSRGLCLRTRSSPRRARP
jgi:tetratricopeptide (TPR) repeat protein